MGTDFFNILCIVALVVATLGILCLGVSWILRGMIWQQEDHAKNAFLRAAENVGRTDSQSCLNDERIRNVNDQTQRGEAS